MFYLAKAFQIAGLLVVLIEFLKNFPDLMSYRMLFGGILLFTIGWVIIRFLLKK